MLVAATMTAAVPDARPFAQDSADEARLRKESRPEVRRLAAQGLSGRGRTLFRNLRSRRVHKPPTVGRYGGESRRRPLR